MKFDIVPYKIDETTVIVGVVIYRGSNNYARFVTKVEELQKELTEQLEQDSKNNQEIVQRLKAEYKKSEDDAYTYCRTQDKEYRDKLKSILEKQG